MCLYVKSGPHIARKDIHVWKVISRDNISMYYQFDYSKWEGKNCPDRRLDGSIPALGIWEGYHAFTNEHVAINQLFNNALKLVKFTVPKGSEYYIGFGDEIVSSSIRIDRLAPSWWRKLERLLLS